MNVYAAEPLIIARLKASLPPLVSVAHIGSAANLVGRSDLARHLPGAFTMPGPADRTDDGDDGSLIVERQTWVVVIATDFSRDAVGLTSDYSALGTLAAAVVQALTGWIPAAGFSTLKQISRADPQPSEGGWVELAITFDTVATIGI